MAKLDIGVGADFPLEEKSGGEDCRRGHRHHHHGSWHDYFRRRFSRDRDAGQGDLNKQDKE